MGKSRRVIGRWCWLLALVAAWLGWMGFASMADSAPKTPYGNAGRWITDANGRVVIIRGINVVPDRETDAPSDLGFGNDDAVFLARQGLSVVRLGVWLGLLEPQPGLWDRKYLGRIEKTVNILGSHGVRTILDFHQDKYSDAVGGRGLPDWMVQTDGLPSISTGSAVDYFANPAQKRAWDHFWANDPGPNGVGLQDSYAAAWRKVAKRFATKPLVFDVRKKSEFDSEHVEGAVNVPLNRINEHLAEFPKDKPFILHCAGGYRSMIAASILKARGWDDFVDVETGFNGIKKTGVRVTEYVCPTTLL